MMIINLLLSHHCFSEQAVGRCISNKLKIYTP